MDRPAIAVVSFDLWDTIFINDSDEPRRTAKGLPPKPVARRDLVQQYLQRHDPIARELVDCAYATADAAFNTVWHDLHVTWTVAERLALVLKGLKRELPEEEFEELVRAHEQMELQVPPDLVPGVEAALSALQKRYRLVVLSDAIFSPGRALLRLLEHYGLVDFFEGFVFSDQIGRSKPAPEVFHHVAELGECAVEQMVHIGDREHNDIAGAKTQGARAVLMTAVIDRASSTTQADAICDDFTKLPEIIAALDAS